MFVLNGPNTSREDRRRCSWKTVRDMIAKPIGGMLPTQLRQPRFYTHQITVVVHSS